MSFAKMICTDMTDTDRVFDKASCGIGSLFIARQHTDIDIVILSVRPSVCLSVRDKLVLYENGLLNVLS